jgi:hypothetical protein
MVLPFGCGRYAAPAELIAVVLRGCYRWACLLLMIKSSVGTLYR